jgi:HlyD family secretion protein
LQRPGPKQALSEAAAQWLARNRSLVLRQTPLWAQAMAGILVSLGVLAVAGGVLFKIDEVVTVKGQLVSIGGRVEVKTPAGGRVAKTFFKDGQQVRQGQLLVRFDTRQAADEKQTLSRMIALEQRELQAQLASFASQRETLVGRGEVLRQKLATKEMVAGELQKLAEEGGYQRLQLLEVLDQVLELRNQLSEVSEQMTRTELEANRVRLESSKNISEMQKRLRQAELQLQYQNVVAPVAGVVFDPKARPEGVLAAGETILTLVPQGGLFAEVFVPNKDIGFVKPGQEAKVRVDAFPFTRYGELESKVSQVAADALPPDEKLDFYRFPVKLQLQKPYLESRGTRIPLQSGMAVTANLKLREKRVISLVSDLLVEQVDSVRSIRQQ